MLLLTSFLQLTRKFSNLPDNCIQDNMQLQINHFLVSDKWLLFNANSAIFQLYHGENKLIFNEMMMRSALF